jgi:uncharacterized protein YuzE
MVATTKEIKRPSLTGDYDASADVLYIAIGEPRPSESEDLGKGIIARYPFDDPGRIWAVTIIGYRANKWDINTLSKRVAHLLLVGQFDVANLIRRTVRYDRR